MPNGSLSNSFFDFCCFNEKNNFLNVDHFLVFAQGHIHLTFYVTQIGCGLAGHSPSHIAPLFKEVTSNVILPKVFIDIINA